MGILCVYFNMAVAIILYDDVVNLLSKSGARLQRIINKLYESCTSSSLEVDLSKTKGYSKTKRHFT